MDGKKQCCRCHDWKPVDQYYKNPATTSGLYSWCRDCATKKAIKEHENHETALKRLFNAIRDGCRLGSKWRKAIWAMSELTADMLIELWELQGGKCAVTGVPMTHVRGKGYLIMTNVSVDRIDNTRGYARDNIRLVCRAVNCMKSNMTDDELLQWSALVVRGLSQSQ